ncbi:MAG: aspartate-semialdehyde dehydrogenase [Sporomusaceae bacterium]|jgi:aspartate-semialdehyde dehydrogenase|nr:aspartate-semialdehyde dehydrogenase [Sporomusaceae bacterium]
MRKYNVAILGATGAVGQEFIHLIEERNFPVKNLKLLASERSAGKKMQVGDKEYTVEEATPESFEGVEIALFAGGSVSKTLAPEAVKRGAVVIDNSSAFRMDEGVPLVVPEVNPEAIKSHNGIIANPNCSTIIMVMALKPIHDAAKIKRVVVSTYQAVSGAGKEGIDELEAQVKAIVEGKPVVANILPSASLPKHYQIAFNLLPHIDVFLENDYTKEEMKMVYETHKILGDFTIGISPTTVRVPVYRSHSESVNIETEKPISAAEAKKLLAAFPGVIVKDDPKEMIYPMPLDVALQDEVFVGRIREDKSVKNGLNMWVVGDQIRKGAALNALQIAEYMVKNNVI